LKQAGEHGLAAGQLGHHRGEGGQSGGSEPAPYPDGVQARGCVHAMIVQPDLVSRRRPGYFGDVGEGRLERSRNWRAR
jgi:hypothetical protein